MFTQYFLCTRIIVSFILLKHGGAVLDDSSRQFTTGRGCSIGTVVKSYYGRSPTEHDTQLIRRKGEPSNSTWRLQYRSLLQTHAAQPSNV